MTEASFEEFMAVLGHQTCDYVFQGKVVQAKCTLTNGHGSSHGAWRDPVTDEPI